MLDSDPPETVLRRLGDREILGMTLGLERPRTCTRWCPRPAAPCMGRVPRGARGGSTGGRAHRRRPLGRGPALRPARGAARTRSAVRCCCSSPRGRSCWSQAHLGRARGRDSEALWLEALSSADAAACSMSSPGRAARASPRGRRPAGGGQSVLRRGARSDADRPRRAPAAERWMDVGTSSPTSSRPRYGPGRSGSPHRPPASRPRKRRCRRPRSSGARSGPAPSTSCSRAPSRTFACSRSATSFAIARARRSSASASS